MQVTLHASEESSSSNSLPVIGPNASPLAEGVTPISFRSPCWVAVDGCFAAWRCSRGSQWSSLPEEFGTLVCVETALQRECQSNASGPMSSSLKNLPIWSKNSLVLHRLFNHSFAVFCAHFDQFLCPLERNLCCLLLNVESLCAEDDL
jgi:hypothetical protein